MASFLNSRILAGEVASGDYAVSSFANPVSIPDNLRSSRSDGFNVNQFADGSEEVDLWGTDIWGDVWDKETGKTESDTQTDLNESQKKEVEANAGSDNTYMYVFVALLVGAIWFFKIRKG